MTVTGLDSRDLQGVTERRKRRLAALHQKLAGSDDGRPWWPLAVRRLSVGQRMDMAEDSDYLAHWMEAERRKVVGSVEYFTEAYGHVQPERQGALPIPFELWPMVKAAAERAMGARSQREVLEAFVADNVVVVLKARQLGLTWLALHFAFWLMGFEPELVRAKVLALSKREEDAKKLLRRLRRINALLPPYLRLIEDRETRGSLTHFKLEGRGEAISLTSTPDAARTEQADLFLWDEAAFARNRTFGETWTSALPTLGSLSKAIVISTGNGPAEVIGDGQGFAKLFLQAAGLSDGEDVPDMPMRAVFLPDDVDPRRDDDYRRRERSKFLSQTDFEQEHALTMDQALAGKQGTKVYPLDGIAAAVELGEYFDGLLAAGEMPPPANSTAEMDDDCIAPGGDWGRYSALLTIWELEAGGVYVPPGELLNEPGDAEPGKITRDFHAGLIANGVQQATRDAPLWPLIGELRYDAAGAQAALTFLSVVEGDPALRRQWMMIHTNAPDRPYEAPFRKVPFGEAVAGGRGKGWKSFTIDYLWWLFDRTAKEMAKPEGERDLRSVIAISRRNKVLLRQLRGLEYLDDGTGRVKKVDDHGPDALIAGTAIIAAANAPRLPDAEMEPATA